MFSYYNKDFKLYTLTNLVTLLPVKCTVQARVRNNIFVGNIQSEVAKDNFISLYQPNSVEESC